MSRSVDLFVDFSEDPHQLVVMLGQAVHHPPVAAGTDRWEVGLGSDAGSALLHRHPYLDDGELRLSRYRWALSAQLGNDGPMLDHPATEALRDIAQELRRHGVKVMLTLDLQNRVALGSGGPAEGAAAALPQPDSGPDGPGDPVAPAGEPATAGEGDAAAAGADR